MTTPNLTIEINFGAPQLRLIRDMNQALECTLLSLHGLGAMTEVPSQLAADAGRDLPSIAMTPRPLDASRPDAERWLFANAFRDAIEHVAAYFEALREADALLSLSGRASFTQEELAETVVAPARAFEGYNFPKKVGRILAMGLISAKDEAHLLSINDARNCLVHRRGTVGEKDVDPATGTMRVTWERPALFVRSPSGQEKPLQRDDIMEAGAQMFMRIEPVERLFRVGESVHFDAADIMGIWHTILQFGNRSTTLLFDKARAHGFVFKGDASAQVAV